MIDRQFPHSRMTTQDTAPGTPRGLARADRPALRRVRPLAWSGPPPEARELPINHLDPIFEPPNAAALDEAEAEEDRVRRREVGANRQRGCAAPHRLVPPRADERAIR